MDKVLANVLKRKIKRRLSYEIIWWDGPNRKTKYFQSARKMRRFVENMHRCSHSQNPSLKIEKTWCYRNHAPRHKWFYVSDRSGSIVCIERY